jgi:hypothetical protein
MEFSILRDVPALMKMIKEYQQICGHDRCSVQIAEDENGPKVVSCMPVLELPGAAMRCCCREPDCDSRP